MKIDKTTYADLGIFTNEENYSIFDKLDFCVTVGGKAWLRWMLQHPFDSLSKIQQTQKIISLIAEKKQWPTIINNGTLMVMDRYYDTVLDNLPPNGDLVPAYSFRVFQFPDFELARYSIPHFRDFVKGLEELVSLLLTEDTPALLKKKLERIVQIFRVDKLQRILRRSLTKKFSVREVSEFGYYFKYEFEEHYKELSEIYYQVDAWYSMAQATVKYKLNFPEFVDTNEPYINAESIYHLLLPSPVPYDIKLAPNGHFLFLTGANMAGKSTFIKALGIAVYLAHVGMATPAKHLRLSMFDGILSNINVVDNIIKGESYFFNEVQRIKKTIETINNNNKWLVLIDELFKGTNMQDAMHCSLAVINGLVKMKQSLFVLSTHLYEIGADVQHHPDISFRYFETSIVEDRLAFSYQLKEGISNDRLGYFILKQEKVVDLLDSL